MKTLLFTLFLLVLCNLPKAQSQNIDSLEQVLSLHEEEDTIRVNLLYDIADKTQIDKHDDALTKYQMGIDISVKLGWKRGEALGLINILEIKENDRKFDEAVRAGLRSLKVLSEINDTDLMCRANIQLGACYRIMHNYNLAELYLKRSLEIAISANNEKRIMTSNLLLSNLFAQMNDWKNSEKYFDEGFKCAVALNDSDALIKVLLLKADRLSHLKTFNEAKKYYLQVLSFYNRKENHHFAAFLESRLSILSADLKNKDSAYYYANAALMRTKEYRLTKEMNDAYRSLYYTAEKFHDYKNALHYYLIYDSLRDVDFNMEAGQEVEKTRAKFEQERKDAIAEVEINKQKIIRNFSIAGIAVILLFGSFSFYRYRKQKKSENKQSLLDERLRISRDLHDEIGSTLGSISVYSEVAKNRAAKNENETEVLSKIGTASRELIDKMSDIVWSLNPQNETFEHLQNRMKSFAAMILTPHNIAFDFSFDEQLKSTQLTSEQRKNIFLIFKEAIYNVVKYAEATEVKVKVKVKEKIFSLEVIDNGKGFDTNNIVTHNGNGLKNMKARTDEMKGRITIESKINEGTRIELELNV